VVIDTSALIAILLNEPDAPLFAAAIASAPARLASAVTRVQTAMLIEGRRGLAGRAELDALWRAAEIETIAVTPAQAEIAIDAFRRFGRGRHEAGLNLGDCFAYALAKAMSHTLLFKGEDFAQTDITAAL